MDAFVPLFLLLMIWIMIGVPLSVAKKAAERQKRNAAPGQAPRKVQLPEFPPLQEQEPPQVLAPTVFPPSGQDKTPYRGSLDVDTGEGEDPCHDEQMASLTLAEQEELPPHPQPARSGIPLGWTENDVVRGIVMSEILTRKRS